MAPPSPSPLPQLPPPSLPHFPPSPLSTPTVGEDNDNGKEGEEKSEEDNHDDEKKGKEMSFRKKRFRLITAVHRVSDQYKQKQPGRGGHGSGNHASPEQRMQQVNTLSILLYSTIYF